MFQVDLVFFKIIYLCMCVENKRKRALLSADSLPKDCSSQDQVGFETVS